MRKRHQFNLAFAAATCFIVVFIYFYFFSIRCFPVDCEFHLATFHMVPIKTNKKPISEKFVGVFFFFFLFGSSSFFLVEHLSTPPHVLSPRNMANEPNHWNILFFLIIDKTRYAMHTKQHVPFHSDSAVILISLN